MAVSGWAAVTILWITLVAPLAAQDEERLGPPKQVGVPVRGKVLKEAYDAAFLGNSHVGYAHHLYQEVKVDQRTYVEATSRLHLTFLRNNQQMQLSYTVSNFETPEGKVRSVLIEQPLGKEQRLVRKGVVEGNRLKHILQMGDNPPQEKLLPWRDDVQGLFAQEQLFQRRTVQPGQEFDFLRFEAVFDKILTTKVRVMHFEPVALLGGKQQDLLRVELGMQNVDGFKPPEETLWIDGQGEPLKRKIEMPGLGELITYRTTKERATARPSAQRLDIGEAQQISVNRAIFRFNETAKVVYHVRLLGVEKPEAAFATDGRQIVEAKDTGFLEITVHGLERPTIEQLRSDREPPKEYLRSNFFLKADDPRVMQFAERVVGKATNPWEKALLIERYVQRRLTNKNFGVAFATADEVARTLEGDCTEHAVLAAAMCRAAGVPARTAVGLVHVPHLQRMSFHMWIEVWIGGKWFSLDPTLGQGRVGACHLKILDAHWNDEQSFIPLLPVVQLLGKLKVEIAEVQFQRD